MCLSNASELSTGFRPPGHDLEDCLCSGESPTPSLGSSGSVLFTWERRGGYQLAKSFWFPAGCLPMPGFTTSQKITWPPCWRCSIHMHWSSCWRLQEQKPAKKSKCSCKGNAATRIQLCLVFGFVGSARQLHVWSIPWVVSSSSILQSWIISKHTPRRGHAFDRCSCCKDTTIGSAAASSECNSSLSHNQGLSNQHLPYANREVLLSLLMLSMLLIEAVLDMTRVNGRMISDTLSFPAQEGVRKDGPSVFEGCVHIFLSRYVCSMLRPWAALSQGGFPMAAMAADDHPPHDQLSIPAEEGEDDALAASSAALHANAGQEDVYKEGKHIEGMTLTRTSSISILQSQGHMSSNPIIRAVFRMLPCVFDWCGCGCFEHILGTKISLGASWRWSEAPVLEWSVSRWLWGTRRHTSWLEERGGDHRANQDCLQTFNLSFSSNLATSRF